jgi:hypothetical protein
MKIIIQIIDLLVGLGWVGLGLVWRGMLIKRVMVLS